MEDNRKGKAVYIIGSLALCAGAFILLPKIIDKLSSFIYGSQHKGLDYYDEEQYPKIVKIEEEEGEADDGCI